jgi:hypothetical protein
VIVGDQRIEPVARGGGAHLAGEFAVVAAQAADGETQLFGSDSARRQWHGWHRRR